MTTCAQPTVVVGSDSWAPSTFTVDNKTAVQVAQPSGQRRSLLVMVDAASLSACHLMDKPAGSTSVGGRSYPLAIGEGVTLNTTAAVYVIADAAAGAVVKVIEEFSSNG